MKDLIKKYWPITLTLLFGVGVFVFWWQGYPEALCYQEQNQLFLWSWDYLIGDLSVAGGLADYLSEMVVQFYYVPWLGALLLGLVFALLLWTLWRVLCGFEPKQCSRPVLFGVSVVGSLALVYHLGDIECLLSFPIAILLALTAARITNSIGRRWWWIDFALVPVLYWLLGGLATWLYVVVRCAFLIYKNHCWWSVALIPWLVAVELAAYNTVLVQYPLKSVMLGINYERVPLYEGNGRWGGFDSELYQLLSFNEKLRNEDWDGIIAEAEQHQVPAAYTSNCVNLALGMKRQLADRMFSFYQSGEDALLVPHQGNNMSMYPSMEAFWQLGLVNSCLRYASDLQESILNGRKSGRLTKRIAECQIVNGQYPQARKNLDLLKQSLFYREWAKEMEQLLGNETAISHDPALGRVRRMRFKNDMLFSYGEKDKIFGLLFINNPDNRLALDYFMGDMLLKGNLQGFMQYMSWVQQYGGYQQMPLGYQDAVRCIQQQGNVSGSPYAEYAKRMMKGVQ